MIEQHCNSKELISWEEDLSIKKSKDMNQGCS